MLDIRVRQQDISRLPGGGDALGDGPELASPTVGTWSAVDDGQARAGEVQCDFFGAVRALIIDQDHAERPLIILGQQGSQTPGDHRRFIPCGDNNRHGWDRPGWGALGPGGRQLWTRVPEPAVQQPKVAPDQE